jgi:hypothetical protein
MRILIAGCVLAVVTFGQQAPDTAAQREAMKKLSFLVGKWTGEASILSNPSGPFKVNQTEEVQYKLDGLILLIEGTGRNQKTGEIQFRALATVAYDDAARTYQFRAYNDGRYLDTEMKAPENGFEWGYKAGPVNVRFVMHLDKNGDWVEVGDVVIGDQPPRRMLELKVHRQ